MAELTPSTPSSDEEDNQLKTLWNASHLLTLGVVNRFFRNYNRYREENRNIADCRQLISLCYEIEHKIYAYENLQSTTLDNSTHTFDYEVSSLILRQQIFEYFEHLHHQLLYRDAELIASIIPLIDRQLDLWNSDANTYPLSSRELIETTQILSHIEMMIQDNLE
jgi:hypothetical protein